MSSSDAKIVITGSTTILPISERWAKLFAEKTGTIVNVQGGGSTHGINAVRNSRPGDGIIGASSRALSAEESEGLEVFSIARDALVVIVNPNNPVKGLNVAQLKDIFNGKINNWKSVGGKDLAIQILNRESGSGTRSTFEDLVMCPDDRMDCRQMSLTGSVMNSNPEIKRATQLIDGAIGYVSYGFLDDSVKAIDIDGVKPSPENIQNEKYGISRHLHYLVRKDYREKSPKVKEFIEFVLSPEGQKNLEGDGFLPVFVRSGE